MCRVATGVAIGTVARTEGMLPVDAVSWKRVRKVTMFCSLKIDVDAKFDPARLADLTTQAKVRSLNISIHQ